MVFDALDGWKERGQVLNTAHYVCYLTIHQRKQAFFFSGLKTFAYYLTLTSDSYLTLQALQG